MSIHRRNLPTGVSPDEEPPKIDAPKKKPEEDPVAAEQRILEELRPPPRIRR